MCPLLIGKVIAIFQHSGSSPTIGETKVTVVLIMYSRLVLAGTNKSSGTSRMQNAHTVPGTSRRRSHQQRWRPTPLEIHKM
jgi:hypothetical protein